MRKAVCHLHLYAIGELRLCIESITQAVVHVVDFSLDIGEVGGENVTVHDGTLSAVAIAKATPAIIAPPAEDEEEEDNNTPRTVSAEHAVAVLVAVSAGKQSHVRSGEFRSHTHIFFSFRNLKYMLNCCATMIAKVKNRETIETFAPPVAVG